MNDTANKRFATLDVLYAIEFKQWNKVFILLGINNMILIDWLNQSIFQAITPGPLGCLLFAVFFTCICWFACWLMDKKKIYIRI